MAILQGRNYYYLIYAYKEDERERAFKVAYFPPTFFFISYLIDDD